MTSGGVGWTGPPGARAVKAHEACAPGATETSLVEKTMCKLPTDVLVSIWRNCAIVRFVFRVPLHGGVSGAQRS